MSSALLCGSRVTCVSMHGKPTMSISMKDQKMLWGRAAGRCSFPQCRMDLYEDETIADEPTHVGENCHIVSEADDGPRGDPSIPIDQRNSYMNLILLCRNHHKIIDAQESEFSVERLHQIKRDHEAWVKEQLDFDAAKQFDDEQYAEMIDVWEQLAHVNEWRSWNSGIFYSGQPELDKEVDSDLDKLRGWLLNRVWPKRYPSLENAFKNFRRVLEDFYNRFHEHAEPWRDTDRLLTRKFYRIDVWDDELYHSILSKYHFHVDLVEDLMLELTRAANLITDRVRLHLMRSYRLHEGYLLVETGTTMRLDRAKGMGKIIGSERFVVEYDEEERSQKSPYPGLDTFLIERQQRDVHFGEGIEP